MAADWRHIAQINQRKTSFAIISFLLIYLFLGMMIAVILSPYPNAVQKIPQIISLPQSQQIMGIFMLLSMFSVLVTVLLEKVLTVWHKCRRWC